MKQTKLIHLMCIPRLKSTARLQARSLLITILKVRPQPR
ncbi:hydroxyproline-rich glycoprotein family protein [Lactobacillus phage P185]|nr:hydroxyproline-rich glycoprotein family protein [Lactobacillus phage P185]